MSIPTTRPPYIRTAVKWGGAGVLLVVTSLWLASAVWRMGYEAGDARSGWAVRCDAGLLVVTRGRECQNPRTPQPGWRCWRHYPYTERFHWWPSAGFDGRVNYFESTALFLPGWMLVVPLAGLVVAAWRTDLAARRARVHLCPNCRYDRTGLVVGAKCPECGAAVGART